MKSTWGNHPLLETAVSHLLRSMAHWHKNNFIKHLQSIRDVLERGRLQNLLISKPEEAA